MTISTGDIIVKFDTQDTITTGTPSTVANNAFSVAGDVDSSWTNAEDVEKSSAVLKLQFDTTMPTVGSVGLYARLLNVVSTNDLPIPDANFEEIYVGSFTIDFGESADTDFYTIIPDFKIPMVTSAQTIEWYIKNDGTAQTIGTDWALYITPKSVGQKA